MDEERYKLTKKAGIFGIVGNIFLLIIKAIVGFIFKSQAMIADSFNSAGDIFASLMTAIGNKIASAPGDEDHNFGHGKAEYIFSLFIGLSMIIVALKLVYDSVVSLLNPAEVAYPYLLIIVCIITIAVKISLFITLTKIIFRELQKKKKVIGEMSAVLMLIGRQIWIYWTMNLN